MPNIYIFSRVFLGNLIDCLAFIPKIEVTAVILIELCRQETKKRKEEETGSKCEENEEVEKHVCSHGRYQPILANTTTDTHGFGCGFGRFRADTKRAKIHVSGHDRYQPIHTQTDTRSNGPKPADTQTVTPAQKSVMKHFLHFSTSKPFQINQARPQTVGNYF